jgi:hypothetical protein
LTLDADATPRTLKLYLGAFNATGRVTATLDDGGASAEDAEVLIVNPTGSTWLNKVVTIDFQAAAATTLTVSYTLYDDHGTDSALQLQAATLQ